MIFVGSLGKSAGSGGFGVATIRVVDFNGFDAQSATFVRVPFEERTDVKELLKAKQDMVGWKEKVLAMERVQIGPTS